MICRAPWRQLAPGLQQISGAVQASVEGRGLQPRISTSLSRQHGLWHWYHGASWLSTGARLRGAGPRERTLVSVLALPASFPFSIKASGVLLINWSSALRGWPFGGAASRANFLQGEGRFSTGAIKSCRRSLRSREMKQISLYVFSTELTTPPKVFT